jgi:hypothetical protein
VVKKINKAVLPDADESESSVDVNLTGSLSNLVSDLVAEPMCPRICASLCSRKIARKFQAPVGWCVGEVTNYIPLKDRKRAGYNAEVTFDDGDVIDMLLNRKEFLGHLDAQNDAPAGSWVVFQQEE